jgi:hypothetical protein
LQELQQTQTDYFSLFGHSNYLIYRTVPGMFVTPSPPYPDRPFRRLLHRGTELMKRKIYTTLGALSLVFFMFTAQGCFYGPGGGWGGGGYGGGYPTYAYGPSMFGPAYVGGHPWGYDHYGFAHGYGHDYVGHGYVGHGYAAGHGVAGGHAVAHEAHGAAPHRG